MGNLFSTTENSNTPNRFVTLAQNFPHLTSILAQNNIIRAITNRTPSEAHPELNIFSAPNNIPRETVLSSLGVTLASDNVRLLKYLLKHLDIPINVTEDEGNTLLHVAILNESLNIFKYLINCNDTDKNALNNEHVSPLILAAKLDKTNYVKKLLNKGADANIQDIRGNTALHYAVRGNSPKLSFELIINGSNVNTQNILGETPLHIACRFARPETVCMLLIYGADPTISCDKGFIPLMIDRINSFDMDFRRIIYNFTFDNIGCVMELKVAVSAMVLKWPLFPLMVNNVCEFVYDESDLEDLNDALPEIKPEHFELFLEKFENVVKDMLHHCCTLSTYLNAVEKMKHDTSSVYQFVYIFLKSNLLHAFIQSRCSSASPISSLVKIFNKNKLHLETLTELVCCLLSYGTDVTPNDLNAVYVFYGRCELFNIILHMDIKILSDNQPPCCFLYDHEVPQQSIMPYFIYDINLNIDKFLQNPHSYLLTDLDNLLNYFAHPKLREFFLSDGPPSIKTKTKLEKLPSVPLLVELARGVAREHIITKLNVKNCRQLYTAIKWLPINDVYKKILTFERQLYYD